jgi:hypothetical protein
VENIHPRPDPLPMEEGRGGGELMTGPYLKTSMVAVWLMWPMYASP